MKELSSLDLAVQHLHLAHAELAKAGVTERFMGLALVVCGCGCGTFFGSFGDKSGCFFQIQSGPAAGEVVLRFGVQHCGFWRRLWQSWVFLWKREVEYEVHLKGHDVARLKDVLRHLEMKYAAGDCDQTDGSGVSPEE